MRNILFIALFITGCTTSKNEVGCNCNEVKDKKVVAHEYPYLYWEWMLYVDYCGDTRWVNVDSSVYDNYNRGDCY